MLAAAPLAVIVVADRHPFDAARFVVAGDLGDGLVLLAGQSDCLNNAAAQFPLASIAQYGARPDVIDDPALTKAFWDASPLGYPGIPTAPVFFYDSVDDEFAPIAPHPRYSSGGCGRHLVSRRPATRR